MVHKTAIFSFYNFFQFCLIKNKKVLVLNFRFNLCLYQRFRFYLVLKKIVLILVFNRLRSLLFQFLLHYLLYFIFILLVMFHKYLNLKYNVN